MEGTILSATPRHWRPPFVRLFLLAAALALPLSASPALAQADEFAIERESDKVDDEKAENGQAGEWFHPRFCASEPDKVADKKAENGKDKEKNGNNDRNGDKDKEPNKKDKANGNADNKKDEDDKDKDKCKDPWYKIGSDLSVNAAFDQAGFLWLTTPNKDFTMHIGAWVHYDNVFWNESGALNTPQGARSGPKP